MNGMKKFMAVFLTALLPFAQAENLTVNVNGHQVSLPVVTVSGKKVVQMPVDFLRTSGALVTGGANQIDALQGCVNQTLFNGMLRVKVTGQTQDLSSSTNKYVGFTVEVSNGTNKDLYVDDVFHEDRIVMIDQKGQSLSSFYSVKNGSVVSTKLLPGASAKLSYSARFDSAVLPMTKLIIPMRDDVSLPFTKIRNLRIDLNCKK